MVVEEETAEEFFFSLRTHSKQEKATRAQSKEPGLPIAFTGHQICCCCLGLALSNIQNCERKVSIG